jgi:hydroxyquinol 1,2-dioxygenase
MAGQRNLDETTITEAVVEQLANTPDPRSKQIMTSLVRHLHEFAREVNLTEDEWFQGIDFLTRTGHMCSDKRQEFILLSNRAQYRNHRRPPVKEGRRIATPARVHIGVPPVLYSQV